MLSVPNFLGTLLSKMSSDQGISTKTGVTCFHFDGPELYLASLQLTMMCTQKQKYEIQTYPYNLFSIVQQPETTSKVSSFFQLSVPQTHLQKGSHTLTE